MDRFKIEALIVCPLAILFGTIGIKAIVNRSIWTSPKYAPAELLTGKPATFAGIGYLGLSLILLAAWAATKIEDRAYRITLCCCAGAIAVFGFAGSIFSHSGA